MTATAARVEIKTEDPKLQPQVDELNTLLNMHNLTIPSVLTSGYVKEADLIQYALETTKQTIEFLDQQDALPVLATHRPVLI